AGVSPIHKGGHRCACGLLRLRDLDCGKYHTTKSNPRCNILRLQFNSLPKLSLSVCPPLLPSIKSCESKPCEKRFRVNLDCFLKALLSSSGILSLDFQGSHVEVGGRPLRVEFDRGL